MMNWAVRGRGRGGGAFLRLCDSMYWCIGYVLVQKIALFIVDDEPAGKLD